ncbi:MAG: hypothetical protein K0M49_15400 [Arenimonas sp.]|nr:hypothetical protein [Rhizobium sp.]MBW8447005.1 hypothetical protein [Arenimonas sp.]
MTNSTYYHLQDVPLSIEEPHVERLRRLIELQYRSNPTGCGTSFGEILCHELHTKSMSFTDISKKWGISCSMLGTLIWDHCQQLEPLPTVDHSYVIR